MQSFFAKMRQIIFAIARDFIRQIFDPLTLSSNETFAISVTRPRVKEIEIKSSTRLLRSAQKVIKDLVYFFKKMGHPQTLFRLFSSFQTNFTIFTTNKCEKMSIQLTVLGFKPTTFGI